MKYVFRYSLIHPGKETEAEASEVAGGHSEVRLLLCDSCNGPIALEFGVTVINHHRPWACPKLASHFQISTGDHQLPEFLGSWSGGEELCKSGCQGPGACLGLSHLTVTRGRGQGVWSHQTEVQAPVLLLRAPSWMVN